MIKALLGTLLAAMVVQVTVTTATSSADGLPILGFEGGAPRGIANLTGRAHFTARATGDETTVVRTGRSKATAHLPGRYAIPVVAYDGSAGGLSADGATLVLIRPRTGFPEKATRLAIVDASRLHLRMFVKLRGDFSLDAISPDGRWIYLIQYTSAVDPTQYRVRALDARTGRLLAHDIVDPHDRGEAMHGNPLTRLQSPDGRRAYTLYDGNGRPFVHALDTAARAARCLDLPAFPANADPWSARLRFTPTNKTILVTLAGRTIASIDTRTLRVYRPASRAAAAKHPAAKATGTSIGLSLPVAAVLVGCVFAVFALRRRPGLHGSRAANARRS